MIIITLDQFKPIKIYLYVLELQNDKYYVGITSNPKKRFYLHSKGKTSCFVRKNLPIKSIQKTLLKTSSKKQAEHLETMKTIELMQKYGVDNVMGGAILGDYHDKIRKLKLLFHASID
ncbi:MAG: GIY-YIG nuclease family protein [Bacteroidales bacterium]|jgi:predicted GIY-YIG superfamily endonuclease|nr:GIY-YIG nuclease family protein [Bacteroidales bacterium]